MRATAPHRLGISEALHRALDGTFAPPGNQVTQRWMCSIVPPWTIVCWWDRSVDSRQNSLSCIIGRGYRDEPNRLLEDARAVFPSVFARQPDLEEFVP